MYETHECFLWVGIEILVFVWWMDVVRWFVFLAGNEQMVGDGLMVGGHHYPWTFATSEATPAVCL